MTTIYIPKLSSRQITLQHAHESMESVATDMESWLSIGSNTKDTVVVKKSDLENAVKTMRGVERMLTKTSENYEVFRWILVKILKHTLNYLHSAVDNPQLLD